MATLLDLVVQSKKALQHGESVCSSANTTARSSAGLALSILAIDAKMRWMKEGVEDQLQLAFHLANCLADSKGRVQEQAMNWDSARAQRSVSLDSILESLSNHVVPPLIHQISSSSSLFGSQHSSFYQEADKGIVEPTQPDQGTSELSSNSQAGLFGSGNGSAVGVESETKRTIGETRTSDLDQPPSANETRKWKTLRDFINEKDLNDAVDRMDADRGHLEDLLAYASGHTELIREHIESIRSALPAPLNLSSGSLQTQPLQETSHGPDGARRGQSGLSIALSSSPSSPSTIRKPNSIPSFERGVQSNPVNAAVRAGVDAPPVENGTLVANESLIPRLLSRQDAIATLMANHLNSLLLHYEQISGALRDHGRVGAALYEGHPDGLGLVLEKLAIEPKLSSPPLAADPVLEGAEHLVATGLSDEDMQVFVRDTAELPSIVGDIEDGALEMESIHEQFKGTKRVADETIERLMTVMNMLDELGTVMGELLDEQRQVETEAASLHEVLLAHIGSLDELGQTYRAYQLAYSKLLIEMDRRKRNHAFMEEFIENMVQKLDQMRDDEIALREQFFADQGQYLPEDLCPSVADLPPRRIVQAVGEETLPDLGASLLAEARKSIYAAEGGELE